MSLNPEQALRFLDHQARRCRDRDTAEAMCLLLPAFMKILALQPMDNFEALDFTVDVREALKESETVKT